MIRLKWFPAQRIGIKLTFRGLVDRFLKLLTINFKDNSLVFTLLLAYKPISEEFVPSNPPVVASILGPPLVHFDPDSKGKASMGPGGVLGVSSPSSLEPNFHSSGE